MASSLRSRLALLLILANIPAALLAIGATVKGRSAETAQRERTFVQHAELIATRAGLTFGIAEGVADTLAANPEIANGGPQCGQQLASALSFRPDYTGIFVADGAGEILCAFGDAQVSEESRTGLIRAVRSTPNDDNSIFLPEQIAPNDRAVLLARPFTALDGQRRAIGLFLRRSAFDQIFLPSEGAPPEQSTMALIRADGTIVSEFTERGGDWRPAETLPAGQPHASRNVYAQSRGPTTYHYAIAPVRGARSSVVMATPQSVIAATDWMRFLAAIGAPLLMLVLGILAVFVGVDRLVLRWIARFRQVTAQYAQGNYAPRIERLSEAPSEIADLGSGINDMAARVRERSTALEEALDGKNALLRELHHRVKNNFQMIASLLALQRRELPARLRVLLRVPEDRVLAMASAYKASYATGDIGEVAALDLLRDIAAQLRQSFGIAAPSISVEGHEGAVWLDLDQAVPLGLLVSEIVTAALERDDAAERPIVISAHGTQDEKVEIEIKSRSISDIVPSTGLAARLVAAYRTQIGATVTIPGDDLVVIGMPVHGDAHGRPGRVELGP